jgi:DNA-binding CsgD family transcriptional regulator
MTESPDVGVGPKMNQADLDQGGDVRVAVGPSSHRLTPTELRVLRLILDGKPNREIACLLSRSRRTVEVHRSHIMRKLGVHTLVDLVKIAFELDLDKA